MSSGQESKSQAWRVIFRPCGFGIIGLALAVALWGYAYKLSLYHLNPNPAARESTAKLWVKHWNPLAVLAAKNQAKEHSFPNSSDSVCPPNWPVHSGSPYKVSPDVSAGSRIQLQAGGLPPLRSPPSSLLNLA